MLVTLLVTLAIVVVLSAVTIAFLAYAMRRPALAQRLMRLRLFRRMFARVAESGLKQMRDKAERERAASGAGAVPLTDLEVMIAGQSGDQAEQAKAMLARMSPRQRRELSQATLGADGISGLIDAAAAGVTDEDQQALVDGLGRSDRRRVQALSAPARPGREAQKRKQVEKRRKARKAGRKR